MIILDTCTIIWDALKPKKLSSSAVKALKNHNDEIIISDISIWEIAMLVKKGRIIIDSTSSEFIQLIIRARNYRIQEITPQIAELSVNFGSEINSDPADRLIAATSILRKAPIVTADKILLSASIVETIW